jgi:hypothetical protein
MKSFTFGACNSWYWLQRIVLVLGTLATLASCSAKREAVYRWRGEDESRTLTLRRDKTFVLEVDGGYFYRVDTGRYALRGDTLILNPDRALSSIDSLIEMDQRYDGRRYMEIMQPEVSFDKQNRVIGTEYRALIFPSVTVNGEITLEIDSMDTSFRRLLIPDSLEVRSLLIRVLEERTCPPEIAFRVTIPPRNPPTTSFRIVLRSPDMRHQYMAGFHWLIKGDTVYASFVDEDCAPGQIRLVKVDTENLP